MKRFRFSEEQLNDFDNRFNYIGSIDDADGAHIAWVYADFALQMFGDINDGCWLLHNNGSNKRIEINAETYHDFLTILNKNLTNPY